MKRRSSIPAFVVDEILLDIQECFSDRLIVVLKTKTMQVLTSCNTNLTECLLDDFSRLFHLFHFSRLFDLFHRLKTQYQQ